MTARHTAAKRQHQIEAEPERPSPPGCAGSGRDWARTIEAAAALAERGDESLPAGRLLLAAAESGVADGETDPHGWRPALARLARAPWSPEADRVLDAMTRPADAGVRRAVDEFRLVCREREADRERAAVATEVRRVVAVSGLSQRAFAARIGTSASRLSSYVHGHVVPSAAMMLRIKREERQLRRLREVDRALPGVPRAC